MTEVSGAGVLVVGSLTVDLTAASERLPSPGETVLGTGFTQVAGGKGANQALAAARMGALTWMVGRVGTDPFRGIVLDALVDAGVRVNFVTETAELPTGIAHIRVDARGDNDIVMVPLANGALTPVDVDSAVAGAVGHARVLLTQMEIPLATTVHALRAGRSAGLITVLDPAPAPSDGLPEYAYALVDVITPNETEAFLLTGIKVTDADSAAAAGSSLVERGCGAALITLGAGGVMVVDREGGARRIAGYSVQSIDSTAAGDAFTGALGSRLAAGDPLTDAIAWANAAGALATTVMGASSSIPTRDAVLAALGAAAATGKDTT